MDGVKIISDGTAEGTYLIVDSVKLAGTTSVRWMISPEDNRAKIVVELEDLHSEGSINGLSEKISELLKVLSEKENLPMFGEASS